MKVAELYKNNRVLLNGIIFDDDEKQEFRQTNVGMDDAECSMSLKQLCNYYERYYNKKTIILLDEYDTPMQEAYIHGYWDVFTAFLRSFFIATFKTNQYLERAIMTGITRVSKESMFSDLNNLNVVTTTSDEYSSCFGFTEDEVFASLDMFGLSDKKAEVKKWYDGFTFGSHKDIYNPWSICNYLRHGELLSYWTNTSSNKLIGDIIRKYPVRSKYEIELLMSGEVIHKEINENEFLEQFNKVK